MARHLSPTEINPSYELPLDLQGQLEAAQILLQRAPQKEPLPPDRPSFGLEQLQDLKYMDRTRAEDRARDDREKEATKDFAAASGQIFDTLGVERSEAEDVAWRAYTRLRDLRQPGDTKPSPVENTPEAVFRLAYAVEVGQIAQHFGYDRDAPDQALAESANAMITEMGTLSEQIRDTSDPESQSRLYDQRYTLDLLVKAAARELGRRRNLTDSLSFRNQKAIQEQTGIQLIQVSGALSDTYSSVIGFPEATQATRGRHHHKPATAPSPVAASSRERGSGELHDWYYIPALAGANVPRHPALGAGWVPGRLGHFALDPHYTGGRLPR